MAVVVNEFEVVPAPEPAPGPQAQQAPPPAPHAPPPAALRETIEHTIRARAERAARLAAD